MAAVGPEQPNDTFEFEGGTEDRASEEFVIGADESLERALIELLENAAEYGYSRVSIEIAADESTVRVEITNDGAKLPPPERGVLVGAEETPLEHGSGIGLWLVYWIVAHHGGDIDVDVSDGTAISLTFPRDLDEGQLVTTDSSDISVPCPCYSSVSPLVSFARASASIASRSACFPPTFSSPSATSC